MVVVLRGEPSDAQRAPIEPALDMSQVVAGCPGSCASPREKVSAGLPEETCERETLPFDPQPDRREGISAVRTHMPTESLTASRFPALETLSFGSQPG